MGIIVDAPDNNTTAHDWALVTGVTVFNIVNSSYEFIQTIQGDYDYLVDMTVGNNAVGAEPGSTYNPETDTFSYPPIDYVAQLRTQINLVFSTLLGTLADTTGMSSEDVITACEGAQSDSSSSFSTNEQALADAIYAWLQSGG